MEKREVPCKFCGKKIIHDGNHWREFVADRAILLVLPDELQRLRTCPKSPMIIRLHAPVIVSDAEQVSK